MQLSRRLRAAADLVSTGSVLADIGTDHGYIPIALVEEKKIPGAIAMDINKGPLARADEHIRQHGLEHQIETRLSDGLHAMKQGEAQSILIAGMGGLLIVRILTEGKEVLEGCRELILQPQSELRSVRSYLEQEHYRITEERLVLEEGKYYVILRAVAGEDGEQEENTLLHEQELRYGPLLLKEKHPLLKEYLEREAGLYRKVLESLEGKETEAASARREEVQWELKLIEEAQKNL